jgi:DNA (cytosine-5)-methyltransferase 1
MLTPKSRKCSPKKCRRPVAIDLFCGCGGLTVGLKRAGFRVIGAVDNDSLAVQTYKMNHPEVKVWETDIRKMKSTTMMKELRRKKIDLLAGCPPCQGFSTMRTLNGANRVKDPRNSLLFEFLRFVNVLRPKTIMLENVPGLADSKIFATFRAKMKKMRYVGDFRILNAADYGVPQRRRRFIYMAGMKKAVPFLEYKGKQKTVRDAISGLPAAGHSGDPLHDMPENHSIEVRKLIKRIPKNGGSRRDLPKADQLECHKRCDGFKDVYGRMSWDEVAPTITSGCFNPSKGRFLHPTRNRAITLREAAILQGFPRRYKFGVPKSKSSIALMIGNALPPPFIASHARQIRRSLCSR